MNQIIKQARAGIKALIKANRTEITKYRYPEVDNGFGKMVPDNTAVAVETKIKCRISHEAQGSFNLNQAPVGLSTNLGRYILVEHNVDIQELDFFTADGIDWRIGPVDPLSCQGAVIGYQAKLLKGE